MAAPQARHQSESLGHVHFAIEYMRNPIFTGWAARRHHRRGKRSHGRRVNGVRNGAKA
jgi:hypothetical protein